MKILVVSNFYPPIRAWGYTLWCQEVSDCLKARGHDLIVLTSDYQADNAPPEKGIYRWLRLENDLNYYSTSHFFMRWKNDEQHNRQVIQTLVTQEAPDLIFIWGMYGMSRSVAAMCERLYPERTVYYISDHWPANPSFNQAYWQTPARSKSGRLAKRPLASLARRRMAGQQVSPHLEFKHAITVSEAVRRGLINAGLPFEHNVTIHGGSDAQRYFYQRPENWALSTGGKTRLLYAGALAEHKGVHTILEALSLLNEILPTGQIDVALVGSGHPDYERSLKALVQANQLAEWVELPGRIEPAQIPELLRSRDILLFPSIYEEPLPRMVQEGMLAGMLVIGTTTGGTGDLLIEEQTGLTFPASDPVILAQKIRWALAHPSQASKIARHGQEHILANFTLEKMVDQIEQYLIGRGS